MTMGLDNISCFCIMEMLPEKERIAV